MKLLGVLQLMINGQAPRNIAPYLAGAGLVALRKPKGGVRPIAVGEILRRLAAKCLCDIVKEDARAYTWPAQVGVACPLGADSAIHTTRSWLERSAGYPDKVLVKLDFKNAFNCIEARIFI